MTYDHTDRPLPAISLPHPMQNASPEELRLKAEILADAAERLLRGDPPQ